MSGLWGLTGVKELAAGAAMLFYCSALHALSPAPLKSYQVVTGAKEQLLLVMLTPNRVPPFIFNDEGHRYTSSGLYRNGGSLTPIWTVDWYSSRVELSRDGRYLVGFEPWYEGSRRRRPPALSFYEEGRLIKAYEVEDLVTDFVEASNGLPNRLFREVEFDDIRQLLRVETWARETILFDITTGERLAVVPTQALNITGRITRPEGHIQKLTDLRVCWADQLLIGTFASLEGTTLKLERIDAVRLGDVVHMERIRHVAASRFLYGLWLNDATARLLDFTGHEVSICGQTDDGRAVMLRLEEIDELEISEVSERLE